jgi:hypothetical protein
MAQQHGRDVFAFDRRVDAGRRRRELAYISEEEPSDIENVDSQIFDNESIPFRKIRLPRENIERRSERHASPKGFPDCAAFEGAPDRLIAGCQRKFSWTINVTFAFSQARTIAFASSSVEAKGF